MVLKALVFWDAIQQPPASQPQVQWSPDHKYKAESRNTGLPLQPVALVIAGLQGYDTAREVHKKGRVVSVFSR